MSATGHVRVIEGKRGPVFYAALRLPDGSRRQRSLGRAWLKRSRPPAGYITRAEAEAKLRAILEGEDSSIPLDGPGLTFGQAAEEWFAFIRDDRKRRPSTVQGYRRELDKNLIPAMGADTPLREITTAHIEAYRKQMLAGGNLSDRSINKRLAQLHAIFKLAQEEHDLPVNPVERAKRQPAKRSGHIQVLTAEEVERLATHASNDQDAALFRVAAYTALRLGELRGLRWGDVDWTRRLIHVRHSYTWGAEGPPKSGKVRSVPLSDQAARALDGLSMREHFTEDGDLVFVSPVGSFMDESALRRRFYKALDAAELPRMRLHDLRHTFGTLAVQAFPLTDVKAFMGHADIQTTMVYVHFVPQHDAADRLSALLGKGDPRRKADAKRDRDPDEDTEKGLEQADSVCRRRDSNSRHADYDSALSAISGRPEWLIQAA
jgi:integrase